MAPRPSIGRTVVFTYTNDLPEASTVFREVLELEFVVDQGACHIFRLTEESYIGVCDLPDRPTESGAVTITLVSDDVEGWHDFLAEKGVRYVKEPGHSDRFIKAIWNSYSKSLTALSPRTIKRAPLSRAKSTRSPSN